ncbi:CLUMA_CG015791, isoform A [Clunio marinus]|uniref:CLUMA_CG015791, isoform A n=1 Tax=Clunio marinus TaxID=568069 RepID=A0A1J1ITM3_9DIPT|nr:CLUMA_CG015791, isoform A [Clunio marinus]
MESKTYKCILTSAVVYSVIFGTIFVGMTVLAILVRNCTIDMDSSPLVYMMFLLYFRIDECKGIINWSNLGLESTVTAIIPPETDATYRTFIFVIVYICLHGALIFTALYSLLGINNSCLGRRSFPMFFVPWLFVCTSIVVMDIVATVYYIMDVVAVGSVEGLMELLEIGNPTIVGPVLQELPAQWKFLPPIIMFLVTAKFFIFLIVDVIVIAVATRAGWAASTYHKYLDETIRHYSSNMSRANPGFEDSQMNIAAQKQQTQQQQFMNEQAMQTTIRENTPQRAESTDRYNDTAVQAFVYPDRNAAYNRRERTTQDEHKQHSIPRPNTLVIPVNYNNDRPTSQQNGRRDDYNDREIESRLSHYTSTNGVVIRSVEPLKDENISEKQQSLVPIRVLPEINRSVSEVKQRPKVPPKPPKHNRHSFQNSSSIDERPENRLSAKVDRNSSNVAEELRGQLPWSYFKARDDVPKKAFTELKEDEELPPVPIPDYTLHFPKSKRINLNDTDGDGSWSRHDQR